MSLNRRSGFTLIELLIVTVIIGILAAIAIPKFANTKERAYVASMKTDLRNMVTAEESYFSDYTTYTNPSALLAATPPRAALTIGVSLTDGTVTGQGWQATASHSALLPTKTCTIWVGAGVQIGTTTEGTPTCT